MGPLEKFIIIAIVFCAALPLLRVDTPRDDGDRRFW